MLPYVLRLSHFILFYLRKKAVEKLATSATLTSHGKERRKEKLERCAWKKEKAAAKARTRCIDQAITLLCSQHSCHDPTMHASGTPIAENYQVKFPVQISKGIMTHGVKPKTVSLFAVDPSTASP
jgi:hypothetical protein